MLVFKNKETTAVLVYQINPSGIVLHLYLKQYGYLSRE